MRQKNISGQLLLKFSLLGSLVLPACMGSDPAALTASPSPETVMARPAATMAATTRPLLEPTPGLNPAGQATQATTIAGPAAETAEAPA